MKTYELGLGVSSVILIISLVFVVFSVFELMSRGEYEEIVVSQVPLLLLRLGEFIAAAIMLDYFVRKKRILSKKEENPHHTSVSINKNGLETGRFFMRRIRHDVAMNCS